ncbi:uncharacterized protein LOC127838808 [Dreissena polymorpha]|uniref:uncharacterized protein LOC127838808 n=1 Tax=Dreissena polymorpha TaxID=45954 RepID=UPI0022647206|nr:uncharacterized protein LOC127838808 [Dreissena polymorpha]
MIGKGMICLLLIPAISLSPTPCEDQPEGVWLGEGSRDCKYLTSLYPEDRIWGVYAARERLCADRSTRCCASCRILLGGEKSPALTPESTSAALTHEPTLGALTPESTSAALTPESTSAALTPKSTSAALTPEYTSAAIPPSPQTSARNGPSLQDTCTDQCLSGVDGTVPGSTCAWLLDAERLTLKSASYFCENGFASGCAKSCSKLKFQTKAVTEPTSDPTVTAETCTDQPEGVWIADGSRDCKYLTSLYPEDQIWGVYAARERLCANSSTRCCASCKAVNSDEKPYTFNENGDNEAFQPEDSKAVISNSENGNDVGNSDGTDTLTESPDVVVQRLIVEFIREQDQERKTLLSLIKSLSNLVSKSMEIQK